MKPIASLSDAELDQELRRALALLPDAPAALQQAALDLFEVPPSPAPSPLQAVVQALRERLEAVLDFDSWAAPTLAPGMRGAAGSTRYLLYSVKGRDIDLRIAPDGAGYALTGQILGPDDSGQVELAALRPVRDAAPKVVPFDDLGEFRIDNVQRGSYVFTLHARDVDIVLPPIEVGDRWT